jgi:hypothetical protein
MELTQIILLIGVAFIVSASITSYLHNRKQNKLPTSEAITKDVMDQIVKKAKVLPEDVTIDLGELPQTSKPKKKRKYYPRKPKTNI